MHGHAAQLRFATVRPGSSVFQVADQVAQCVAQFGNPLVGHAAVIANVEGNPLTIAGNKDDRLFQRHGISHFEEDVGIGVVQQGDDPAGRPDPFRYLVGHVTDIAFHVEPFADEAMHVRQLDEGDVDSSRCSSENGMATNSLGFSSSSAGFGPLRRAQIGSITPLMSVRPCNAGSSQS